ncbi:MAG: LLM class flavin-dependent oxidoreductase [Agrococcus casei]|uniref:LLM class flavin-dependent oxidoreductase n=2 Tax=Agrococcus casei TaxID=343512 RepID=UPI003F9355E9
MRAFGFLSFGHYGSGPADNGFGAKTSLHSALDLAVGADELGVNGAYFRVHHFAKQNASPMPLLSAIAARTKGIEVGTGVIDMRYENPLYLAEEAAALDLLSDGRVALGISRGSPEPARRGWEAFGYEGDAPAGADMAREKFAKFMRAVRGETMTDADPAQFGPGQRLRVEPHSPELHKHIWWGAGSRDTARWAGEQGVNMMSSTLLTEADGTAFGDLQAEQIDVFRQSFADAGHGWTPRVSVSRSVFPIMDNRDRLYFGLGGRESNDQIGVIDGLRSTFGKTYADTPDRLIEQLRDDAAVMSADTLMLTVPNQLGTEFNLHILESFAKHVAPELGWKPNTEGPVEGDAA